MRPRSRTRRVSSSSRRLGASGSPWSWLHRQSSRHPLARPVMIPARSRPTRRKNPRETGAHRTCRSHHAGRLRRIGLGRRGRGLCHRTCDAVPERRLHRGRSRDADLSNANLSGANLTDVNLSGADLTSANLAGAQIIDADLSDADLTRANLTGATITETNLDDAVLCGTTRTDGTVDDTSCPATTEYDGYECDARGRGDVVRRGRPRVRWCGERDRSVSWETDDATSVEIALDTPRRPGSGRAARPT